MVANQHDNAELIRRMRDAIGGMFPGLADQLETALGGRSGGRAGDMQHDLDPNDWCGKAAAHGGRSSISLDARHILEYKRARLKRIGVEFVENFSPTAGWQLVVAPPGKRKALPDPDESPEHRALALLVHQVRVILDDLGPGGYLLPAGSFKTNALESVCNEAAAVLAITP